MKKIIPKKNSNIPKIPYSKATFNKKNLEISTSGLKNSIKQKNDSLNKETTDHSYIETLSLSKKSNLKLSSQTNNSFYKSNKKKIYLYTSSYKSNNNSQNKFSKQSIKTIDKENSENISSSEDIISMDKNIFGDEDEDTNKIDYRYYPKMPEIDSNKDKMNNYFWLATYDKLMKKSKIVKILNYYEDTMSHKDTEIFVIEFDNSNYKEEETKERKKKMNQKYNFKEKTMIFPGYEIFFLKKHGNPFIRPKKDGKIFIKLYLLNIEQINQIFSYINRLEYKKYIKNFQFFDKSNNIKKINNNNKTIYNYSTILYLGKYMNTDIFSFTHTPKDDDLTFDSNDNYTYNLDDLPSAHKISKLLKILINNFPDFNRQYFLEYLMKLKYLNINQSNSYYKDLINQKVNEVNSYILTNKNNSKKNIFNTKNIIKNTIQEIPIYSPSPFSLNNFSNNSKGNNNNVNNLSPNFPNFSGGQINCSDFLSNIKDELKGIISSQKQNENDKKNNESKSSNKVIFNNVKYTRNNNSKNNILSKFNVKTFSNNDNLIIKNIECKTIKLNNSFKKSLTKNNSKQYIHYNRIKKSKTRNNSFNNSIDTQSNNKNVININSRYEQEDNDIINKNQEKNNTNILNIKYDKNKNSKFTRNKPNIYSPLYSNTNTNSNTNSNTINKDHFVTQSNNAIQNNQSFIPIKVSSSIKRVISQQLNNLSQNTNPPSYTCSNNNSSFAEIKNNYYACSNMLNLKRLNKIMFKTNNNSFNKMNEYITPLKKKFYYYYH